MSESGLDIWLWFEGAIREEDGGKKHVVLGHASC